VARRSDEVKANVNSEINFINTARLLLLQHIRLVLIVQEFNDGHPRIAVVNIVSKTRCIDDG